jgi:CO/xanthine dehydrogenase Mo-binding subunit
VTASSGRAAHGKGLSYAELVGDRKLTIKVNVAAPLKDPKDYTIVGKPVPRLDIPAKIFGTFNFVQDVKVPGMVHARMVHPAAVRARLESFNDAACRKIPGYVRAVRKGDFLAVVATNEWAAISASNTIVAKWSNGRVCRTSRSSSSTYELEDRRTKCFSPVGTRRRR